MALHPSLRNGPSTDLRKQFDMAAQDYDAVRPGYPEALLKDMVALAELPPRARLLEIGCGTGQATLPLVERGYHITALDLGANMAALASRKLEPYPNASVLHSPFETFEAEPGSFDLILAATAWHWLDPKVGYPKAARFLKAGGSLAVFSNLHPRPYMGFFETSQPIYDEIFGPREEGPSTEDSITQTASALSASGHFHAPLIRTYAWTRRYSTADYLRLLNTYSDHRQLEPATRARLFERLAAHIEKDYGGSVLRPYLSVLFLASLRSS